MEIRNCGSILISCERQFNWIRGDNGEIFGHIENSDGSIKKGSSGWYRTNDQHKAAKYAEEVY